MEYHLKIIIVECIFLVYLTVNIVNWIMNGECIMKEIGILIVIVLFLLVVYFVRSARIKIKHHTTNLEPYSHHKGGSQNVSPSTDLVPTELKEITEIILGNTLGEELTFTRGNVDSKKEYYEVIPSKVNAVAGPIVQAALPVAARINTLTELSKRAPHGLFAATADVSTLSKFKDGTFTTMVRDTKNKMTGHAGFKSIGELRKVSPIELMNIGMQAAAIVSSQYYLEEINSQLTSIDHKMNQLIELHHDKELGILLNAKRRLEEIVRRKLYDERDIEENRILRNDVNKVFEHYKLTLEREQAKVINQKLDSWFVDKRVKSFESSIEPLRFLLEVCYEANHLSLQAELVEILIRTKMNIQDPMVPVLSEQLKANMDNGFSQNLNEKSDVLFAPIYEKAEKVIGDGKDFKIFDKGQQKLLQQIMDRSKKLISDIAHSENNKILQQVLENQKQKQEVLIMIDNKNEIEKMFIPVNN